MKDYPVLQYSTEKNILNLGMWSYVSPAGFDGSPTGDIIVSGLREEVRFYSFERMDDRQIPVYSAGKKLAGLDGWNLSVIPLLGRKGSITGLLLKSGCSFIPAVYNQGTVYSSGDTDLPRPLGKPVPTGAENYLDTGSFNRTVSNGTLFRRSPSGPWELLISVADMSDYYPGEPGLYGGRAIGIDQEGENIGYDETGNWRGGTGKGELHLFLLHQDGPGPAPRAEYRGRLSTGQGPLATVSRSGTCGVGDFDGDGRLEAVVLNDWRLEAYRLSAETDPGGRPRKSLEPPARSSVFSRDTEATFRDPMKNSTDMPALVYATGPDRVPRIYSWAPGERLPCL